MCDGNPGEIDFGSSYRESTVINFSEIHISVLIFDLEIPSLFIYTTLDLT